MQRLINLFEHFTGSAPESVEPIKSSGSSRKYYRLTGADGKRVIGCIGSDAKENRAFCCLSHHFAQRGLPVPLVHRVSADGLAYIQQDLGDRSLYDLIKGGNFTADNVALLRSVMDLLARVHFEGSQGLDFSVCYPAEALDMRGVMWDLNYFKYCFLKPSGVEPDDARLEDDMARLAADILNNPATTFMYRDFQSRNIMVSDEGEPYLIDFQGGRRGPIYYDLASFLWQARAGYTAELRESLIDCYLASASRYVYINPVEFRDKLRLFALFRSLQTLGAYGFRGLVERKQAFLTTIPAAITQLRELIYEGAASNYPYLKELLWQMCSNPRFLPEKKHDGLLVKVISFSYKKGLPEDFTGNGGGFVFDTRSIHNPGKYDQYKPLTGRDKEVIEFIEANGEAKAFLANVFPLVGHAVEKYQKGGFTDLMICFGCTGGRHRSVYCAEQTAHYLHDTYGVDVLLIHRERGIEEFLSKQQEQ